MLWERRLELLPLLAEMLFVENQEAVLEAARAFGNLSRCPEARRQMPDTRVDEALGCCLWGWWAGGLVAVLGLALAVAAVAGGCGGDVSLCVHPFLF